MRIIKILISIIIISLISSCYDYREVNDIDIITGIGIDIQNNDYYISLEILKNKGDKQSMELDSSLIIGKGLSIASALENATNQLSKSPNYAHLKVMILSKKALEEKWFSIMDYFLRNTDFRENFYVVATNNSKPETILKTKNDQDKVVSIAISNYLENNKSTTINNSFEEYAKYYTTFNKSLIFTNVDIKDDLIITDGALIYNNNHTILLNNNDVDIYNLFNNKSNIVLNKIYDDKYFSIIINNSKLSLNIKNGKLLVNGSINAQILNNETNLDLKRLKTITMLNNDFKAIIEKRISDFLLLIQNSKTDLFGLDYMYFQKTRKKANDYWLYLDIVVNIDFSINKKGLIYEVEYEK